ncbi:MAG: aldo/keto reductase [Brachybacterium sp.]
MNSFTLHHDVRIPQLGLGVFQTPPEQTVAAVDAALEIGYRHLDTAAAYGNEKEVGQALRESGLNRNEVFVETKIWISDYGTGRTAHGLEKSLAKLELDQIDLVLLHQPLPTAFDRTLEAYRELEAALVAGTVRAIGVSNFLPEHLTALLESTEVVPAVNQIEVHPYFQQRRLEALNTEHGILTQAWSPIGGITSYRQTARTSFEDPILLEIAAFHGATPAQVMLAWHRQQGRQVIPKSVRPERLRENFAAQQLELSTEQLARIDALETGVRGGPDPADVTLEAFGREIPEA